MPYRKSQFQPGEYYHLYHRAPNRQMIFFTPENWAFFIKRLGLYFQEGAAAIVAYCLMPTHYHLLVQIQCDNFPQKVMQPLLVSYTKAINKQQKRNGALFQGPFQAVHVDNDDYLLQLSRYIHRNPLESGLVKRAEDWQFSSYRDYLGLRKGNLPHSQAVLGQFNNPEDYRLFVEDTEANDVEKISHLLLDLEKPERNQVSLRNLVSKVSKGKNSCPSKNPPPANPPFSAALPCRRCPKVTIHRGPTPT